MVQKWTCVNFSRMHIDAVHRLCGELVYTCNAIGMVSLCYAYEYI